MTTGGVLSINTGELTSSSSRATFGGVGGAVGSHHAEIIAAIGQNVAIQQQRILGHIRPQQLPFLFVFAAEIERIDQTIAIRIVGLPGDLDL